jgi:hypothetical protein
MANVTKGANSTKVGMGNTNGRCHIWLYFDIDPNPTMYSLLFFASLIGTAGIIFAEATWANAPDESDLRRRRRIFLRFFKWVVGIAGLASGAGLLVSASPWWFGGITAGLVGLFNVRRATKSVHGRKSAGLLN